MQVLARTCLVGPGSALLAAVVVVPDGVPSRLVALGLSLREAEVLAVPSLPVEPVVRDEVDLGTAQHPDRRLAVAAQRRCRRGRGGRMRGVAAARLVAATGGQR